MATHLLAALLVLAASAAGRHVTGNDVDVADPATASKLCHCRMQAAGRTLMDYGVIRRYDDGASCWAAHHDCRVSCVGRLQLSGSHADRPETQRLGYRSCAALASTTPRGGVALRAVWNTSGCRHNGTLHSHHAGRLCCGLTAMTHDRKNILVLSWNPDCRNHDFLFSLD